MSLKTLEESIREYPTYKLEEVVGENQNEYSEEAIEIAVEEIFFRKLKSLNQIEQIDYIKSLRDNQLHIILKRSEKRYSSTVLNIIQKEYAKRGMEDEEWYYLDNNKPIGPLKLSNIKKLAENGTIFQYSLIFREGTQNWVYAGSVPGIFEFVSTNIPPPPPSQFYNNIQCYNQIVENQEVKESTDLGCGLSLVCFLFPIIGVILFFTEKNEKGKNALALAFVGFIIGIVLYFMYYQMLLD